MALGQTAARTDGDIYQAHIFWYYAAKLLDDTQSIEEVSFEYDQVAGVDDICIKYKNPGLLENENYYVSDFIQVKYHVDKSDAYSSNNLCDPSYIKSKKSLLQKFWKSFQKNKNSSEQTINRYILLSNWEWNPEDPLCISIRELNGALPDSFFTSGNSSKLEKIREKWKSHLNISDDTNFIEFCKCLRFNLNFMGRYDLKGMLNDRLLAVRMKSIPIQQANDPYISIYFSLLSAKKNCFNKKSFRDRVEREDLFIKEPNDFDEFIQTEKLEIEKESFVSDHNNPVIIKIKLKELLDSDKIDEAISLIKNLSPNSIWCDIAVLIFIKNGDKIKAKYIVEWSKTIADGNIRDKCRLNYAKECFIIMKQDKQFKNERNKKPIMDEINKEIFDILTIIKPIIDRVKAEKKIYNEIESQVIQLTIEIYFMLDKIQELKNLAPLLLSWNPIPLVIGFLALQGIIKLQSNIPERIRKEHPDSQKAAILSAILESEVFNEHETAYINLKMLIVNIQDDALRFECCSALYQIAQYSGIDFLKEIKAICSSYLGENNHLTLLIQADIFLKMNQVDEAKSVLSQAKNEDNPLWLQLYSQYLLIIGNQQEALDSMNKVCTMYPHPGIIYSTAKLAYSIKNYNISIDLLKKILISDPLNIDILENLATLFYTKGNFQSALEYYKKLIELIPSEISFLMNIAACYVNIGELDSAIDKYTEICNLDNPPLSAFLSRAYLLSNKAPIEAFESISPIKDKYWEDPQYLQVYFNLSFKAGNEELGHSALMQLKRLQEQGKLSQEILQEKKIDELVNIIKEQNERYEEIYKIILQGELPWLCADSIRAQTLYFSWLIRTQHLPWRIENPESYATYSLYSTNGFHKSTTEENFSYLEFLHCPEENTDIIIDISALITIHQLGLLEICISFFNKIYIPQDYIIRLVDDGIKLQPHQITNKISSEKIKNAIALNKIYILEDTGKPGNRPMPYIHEHSLPEEEQAEHFYCLFELLDVALEKGKITENNYQPFIRAHLKRGKSNPDFKGLKYGQAIWIDIQTLQTICQINSETFDSILNTFKVFISKADYNQNNNDLFLIEKQKHLKLQNDELLTYIRSNPKLIKLPVNPDLNWGVAHLFIASWQLTKEKSLPLLADDRVLQAITLNSLNSVEHAGFGTDRLLLKLYENKIISIDELSNNFLTLMKWRYRFIIPTKAILLTYAKRYKNHPPGQNLLDISIYIHECMRDPGLFSGIENTTNNEHIAGKLYGTWAKLCMEFIASIWADFDFSDKNAELFTKWIINEFLPSFPQNIPKRPPQQGKFFIDALFGYYLYSVFIIKDEKRVKKALISVVNCLGMTKEEYLKQVINLFNYSKEKNSEEDQICKKTILAFYLKHFQNIDQRSVVFLHKYGVLNQTESEAELPNILPVLKNSRHPFRIKTIPGPHILYYQKGNKKKITAIDVAELFLYSELDLRKCAFDHFQKLKSNFFPALSESSFDKVVALKNTLLSNSNEDWRNKAIEIYDAITVDWFYDYAILHQYLEINCEILSPDMNKLIEKYLTKVLRPSLSTIENIKEGMWSPTKEQDAINEEIKQIINKESKFINALNRYLFHFGHLPLSLPFSINFLINEWQKKYKKMKNLWGVLWDWADNHTNILSRFHVCMYFIINSDQIPEKNHSIFWKEIINIVYIPFDEKGDLEYTQTWRLFGELARYFCFYLETLISHCVGEKIATLSLWFAMQVCSLFPIKAKMIKQLREVTFLPIINTYLEIWKIATPAVTPSALHFILTQTKSIFSFSLQAIIGENLKELKIELMQIDDFIKFAQSLSGAVLSTSSVNEKENNEIFYAFNHPILKRIRFINNYIKDESEAKDRLNSLISRIETLLKTTSVKELLIQIADSHPNDQFLILNSIKNMVLLEDIPLEDMWSMIENSQWREIVINSTNPIVHDTLFKILQEIIIQRKDKWAYNIPHFYAIECEKANEKEKINILFTYVIYSCFAGNTVSAVQRLLSGPNKDKYIELIDFWRNHLTQLIKFSPEIVKDRIRSVLAVLRL